MLNKNVCFDGFFLHYLIDSYLTSNNYSKFEKETKWDTWYINTQKCSTAKNIGQLHNLWFSMSLVPNKTYEIWLYDPTFFILSFNPISVPAIKINNFKDMFNKS